VESTGLQDSAAGSTGPRVRGATRRGQDLASHGQSGPAANKRAGPGPERPVLRRRLRDRIQAQGAGSETAFM
jgi:hypothetical protein